MADDVANSSRTAMDAYADKLDHLKGADECEGRMASELQWLHLILHGDARPDGAKQPEIVRSFFGADAENMDEPECSKWSKASIAVAQYGAAPGLGLAALVQWEKAFRTAESDIREELKPAIGRTMATKEAKAIVGKRVGTMVKTFDRKAPNKNTETTRAAALVFPESDTLKERHANNLELAAKRKNRTDNGGASKENKTAADTLKATLEGADELWTDKRKRAGFIAGLIETLGHKGAAELAAMLDRAATEARKG
tara:strand:+ start:66 stop:830 length:765 start_codon:yes stop_codon:yes gene_type:complete